MVANLLPTRAVVVSFQLKCFLLLSLHFAGIFSLFAQSVQGSKAQSSRKSAVVREHLGKPTLVINDKPVYPIIYAITDMPGARWTWEEVPKWNLQQFQKAGFRIYQVDIWLENLWPENGILDIGLARRQVKGVLDVDPNASIILRLHVNAPRWWQNKYPDECTSYADTTPLPQKDWGMPRGVQGDLDPYLRHSFASKQYLKDCGQKLAEFCRKFSQVPEGNSLVGMHIADGVFHEWHYWAFFKHYPDTGPAMTDYFREWLKTKYKNDATLRSAWNDDRVNISDVNIPGKERLVSKAGVFRNPETERRMIDYVEAQHKSISDAIIHFCKIAKESWPRPIITGVFYGYFFTMFGRQAAGGHLDVSDVMKSPYVDYLSAPLSYQGFCRNLGGSGQSRGVIESCRFNGKLWIDEMDQATTIEQDGENLYIKDLHGDIAKIRRNIAQAYTRGIGSWYYDFGIKNVRGWWGNQDLMNEIQKLREVFEVYHKKPFVSPADVLFVYDTESYYHMGYDYNTDPVSPAVIDLPSADAYHSGATFHMVYLDDLPRIDLKPYKVIVFANTFHITEKQRKFIKENVAVNGRHLVWNYMPGYTDGKKLDPSHVADLTGFAIELNDTPVKLQMKITDSQFPKTLLQVDAQISPTLSITDGAAKALGYYVYDSARVSFAVKKLGSSTSWFSVVPLSNPGVFRSIFKAAGVHVYNEDGDVIYDGGGILSIHSLNGGKRKIKLRNGREVNLEVAAATTTILDSNNGEVLIR